MADGDGLFGYSPPPPQSRAKSNGSLVDERFQFCCGIDRHMATCADYDGSQEKPLCNECVNADKFAGYLQIGLLIITLPERSGARWNSGRLEDTFCQIHRMGVTMRLLSHAAIYLAVTGVVASCMVSTTWAQAVDEIGTEQSAGRQLPQLSTQSASIWEESHVGLPAAEPQQCQTCQDRDCAGCESDRRLFGSAEFLLVRPHFSEAIAFAQGTQTAATFDTVGRELQFDYEASVRATAGYRFDNGRAFQFTFSRLSGDTSVVGAAPGAGQFIVDPFGNLVGAITIIDPTDARFSVANPFVVTGGDRIDTNAVVETNIYDLELTQPILADCGNWDFNWSFGVRIADVDQSYSSVVTNGGAFFARGDFSVDFIGAGPRIGLETTRYIGQSRRLSFFAKSYGSLLVGEYVVRSSNRTTVLASQLVGGVAPFPFRSSQAESLTRLIPVIDMEVGAAWEPCDSLTLSAGWLFQSWHDFGTSGGKFAGLFGGADDANIMSFDGLTLRAELAF